MTLAADNRFRRYTCSFELHGRVRIGFRVLLVHLAEAQRQCSDAFVDDAIEFLNRVGLIHDGEARAAYLTLLKGACFLELVAVTYCPVRKIPILERAK